jgi:CHAT domain-containing protein
VSLEQAIDHFDQALQVYTRQSYPQERASAQRNLANLHYHVAWLYAQRVGETQADDLDRAIEHYEAALEIWRRDKFPQKWASAQHGLGVAWFHRVHGSREKNLEEAIACHEAALSMRMRNKHPAEWAETQHNLGAAYIERYRDNRAQNLERAIELLSAVLETHQHAKHPVKRAKTRTALGNAYLERIRGERADNVERAIQHYKDALAEQKQVGPPEERATTNHNLGIAYAERLLGDRGKNLGWAIAYLTQALKEFPEQTFSWAIVHNDLADSHWRLGNYMRHTRSERAAYHLEQAITHAEIAAEVYKHQGFLRKWALAQHNLGNAYCDRLEGDRAKNLEEGIRCYRAALEVRTREAYPFKWAQTQNNLGTAYWERVRGNRKQNLERAVCCFCRALEVHTPQAFPVNARRAARNLGNLLFGEGRWTEAHAAYITALQAAEALYTAAFMEAGREAEIGENATLYAQDAFCLAHLGQLREALVKLEEGKTRTLAERLGRDAVQLEKARPEDQKAYRELLNRLKALEAEQRAGGNGRSRAEAGRPYTEIARDVKRAREELNTLTQRIRDYVPDFLPTPLDFDAIQALVPDEQAALVEFCVTEKGSVVLVVRPEGEPEVVWMEGFTQFALHRLLLETPAQVQSWLKRYQAMKKNPEAWETALSEIATSQGRYRAGWQVAYQLWQRLRRVTPDDHPARSSAQLAWLTTIERVLTEVGLRFIAPLCAELQQHNLTQLILIPQGSLFLLPLHAVPIGQDGACLLDRYEVSYVPSATVLQRCQERAIHAQTQGLFAIANPTGDIAYAGSELQVLESLFEEHKIILWGKDATKETTLTQASGHGYVHFSCHGQYDWDEPSRSALLLAGSLMQDGEGRQIVNYEHMLTLTEVEAKLDLAQTYLITLSACETGLSEAIGPRAEEYIGLPAGFLLAGAPAVLASLWGVYEISTTLLMERFYLNHRGELDEKPDPKLPLLSAGEALRRAQIWLRDKVTAQEAARRCKAQIEKLRSKGELVPPWLSRDYREYAQMARKTPDSRPFAHPFYWAAFALSGATDDPDRLKGENRYA